MCKLTAFTYSECGHLHHSLVNEHCPGSRVIDGVTCCSRPPTIIKNRSYDGMPLYANCYLAQYVKINSRIHKEEQKELSYLLEETDPHEYIALSHALHEYFAYERKEAIMELNLRQGCNGL